MNTQSKDRKSVRLPQFDYSNNGAYFVTVCSKNRQRLFGRIEESVVRPSSLGILVAHLLKSIPNHFPNFHLDEFIVMPNHLHAILAVQRGTACRTPMYEEFGKPVPGSIATVVRSFKSEVTRRWRSKGGQKSAVIWQRGYYLHVIRDQDELNRVRRYIRLNPLKWELDQYYPHK